MALGRAVLQDARAGHGGQVAQTLYEETEESKAAREQRRLEHRYAARPLGADLGARPTKQARRRLEALRKAQRRDDL